MKLINDKATKIHHCVRFLTLILLMGISIVSFAQDNNNPTFEYGNFKFRLLDTPGECELLGKADSYKASGDLIIPSTAQYEGKTYTVTSIFTTAFINNNGFTGTLTIPESIKTIGPYAFCSCKNLTGDINIPSKVTSIGAFAFAYCTGFRGSLTLPESLTEIGNHAFDQCKVLTGTLNIPKNVTTIGDYAFNWCNNLTGELVIPNSVTSIGSNAFKHCIGFTGLVLPGNLTAIKNDVFSDCSGLTGSLTIPNNVTSIGNNAFKDCTSLNGTLILGTSLTKMGTYPFSGCAFTEVNSLNPIPPTSITAGKEADIFTTANQKATLIVPDGATEAYSNSVSWMGFYIVDVEEITLSETKVELTEGETALLTATISPEDATDKTVTWTSEDESIATVDENGKITTLKPGTTTITATATNGVSASCTIIVNAIVIAADGITLDIEEAALTEGETLQLTATITPEDATDKSVKWSSANETIAKVDETGKVLALNEGSTNIKATTANGLSASCKITVKEAIIAADAISINIEELEITEGDNIQLTAAVLPVDATDKTVTWSSADESIAIVNNNGVVTALQPGTTNVTVTTANDISASCKIIVKPAVIATEGVSLNLEEAEITEGKTLQLTAIISPDDATDKSVKWGSADRTIATVDAYGKVYALKPGTTVITATTTNRLTASCKIIVNAAVIAANGITLNIEQAEITEGESLQLSATVSPQNTTDKSVTWASTDASVATVDATGKVAALKPGTTNITATTANGLTASCNLTVNTSISAINGTYSDNKRPFIIEDGDIIINGDIRVEIFNLNGVKVHQSTGGRVSGLPHGFYLLRTTDKTYKINL